MLRNKLLIFPALLRRQFAIHIEKVPALGESITEGSIQKWIKQVNDQVQVDDIVAIIETDKVTVDIKSSVAGVLVEQMATDNVNVGMPLFKINTDGTSAPSSDSKSAAPVAKQAIASSSTIVHPHSHVPLIKFLGKRSHVAHLKSPSTPHESLQKIPAPSPKKTIVKEGTGIDFFDLKGGAWYGRPKLSQEEMDAIESGGASLYN